MESIDRGINVQYGKVLQEALIPGNVLYRVCTILCNLKNCVCVNKCIPNVFYSFETQ